MCEMSVALNTSQCGVWFLMSSISRWNATWPVVRITSTVIPGYAAVNARPNFSARGGVLLRDIPGQAAFLPGGGLQWRRVGTCSAHERHRGTRCHGATRDEHDLASLAMPGVAATSPRH